MTENDHLLLLEEPPPIKSTRNPMPMDWEDRVPRHRELWERPKPSTTTPTPPFRGPI